MDDWGLLNQYVKDGSEEAFGELVRRHTPMVYASALRRAGRELAEDVTQAVFVILARKADRLRRRKTTSLTGWLFRAAKFSASEALRAQARRQKRERTAEERRMMMMEERQESSAWEEVMPVLDAALDNLNSRDREAALLRYFEGASYSRIGDALGVSEDAAAKRVSRAMTKLRKFFTGKGIVLSLPALATILTSTSAGAAPAGLPVSCATAALAGTHGAGVAIGVATMAQGAMKMMLVNQLKTAAVTGCAVLATTVGTVVTVRYVTDAGLSVVSAQAQPPFRVERVEKNLFPLTYKGRSTLPDGSLKFQINSRGDERTYFAKLGEEVNGFTLLKHEEKREKRTISGLKEPQEIDVSELTLQRNEEQRALVIDRRAYSGDCVAHIASLVDSARFRARIADIFEVQGARYEVVGIDPRRNRIVVRRLSDGRNVIVSKDGRD